MNKHRRPPIDPSKLQGAMPLLRCPCGKVFSPSKEDARTLRRQIAGAKGHTNMVRYYECADGAWHWTENLDPYRICKSCKTPTDPNERRKDPGLCDTCYDLAHPTLHMIPAPSRGTTPTPALFARRTA